MNPRIHFMALLLLLFVGFKLSAQTTRKVLFIGNSYTGVNNLPQMVKDAALSAGDNLIFDSHTPGGYTLEDHSMDPVTQNKIMAGGWDYVVLQGQSQEPITQTSNFNHGGNALVAQMYTYNSCAIPMLYITWGRKNGDVTNCASFPVMCTYAGMDSTIKNNYLDLADDINAEVSPVSVVWNYLRQNHPSIELYQADESHPSQAGTYAAACCFYAAIFKMNPTLITYNAGLNATDASYIRNAAKTQVFDHLSDWDYKQLPQSYFQYDIGPGLNEVFFYAINGGVSQTYLWDFGDGNNSTLANPTHSYMLNGTYSVTLTTTNCDLDGIHTSMSDTLITFCSHTPVITTAHSWLCEYDTLWTQAADSYQWYAAGSMIPVTSQYLPDYMQFGSGISVVSTVGGCSEESAAFSETPEWSGYYFDTSFWIDPCDGDSAFFTVLNINGLTGDEVIHWYKNDTLLSFANNQDTLFILGEGNYQCRVVNPTLNCPWDTTVSSVITIDCGVLNVEENSQDVKWKIYPNPTSEMVTLELINNLHSQEIEIYNATGRLMQSMEITSTTNLNIAAWPNGLYFIRLKNHRQPALKLMKQ